MALLKEAGEITDEETEQVLNEFTSVNDFDCSVFLVWVLIKEQAIYTSGLSSTPISLDLAKVIKILRFFGLKDKEFGRWMLLQLVQISNIIFTAQIEVANATNSQG